MSRCSLRSSSNCLLMRKERPARVTSASSLAANSGAARSSVVTKWAGSLGAPMVATARTLSSRWAAANTAAPPRLCPTSNAGAPTSDSMNRAAASRSSMLELKLVSAKSPPLSPSPVKSKEKTAIPSSTRARLIRLTALRSLEQVKQWANSAAARIGPTGRSRRADRMSSWAPGKVRRVDDMVAPECGVRSALGVGRWALGVPVT